MDFKFSRETETGSKKEAPAEKGRQNGLLVLLLILVAGFGYLYFFTGLIRPLPEQKTPAAPAPQVVKKPLPPSSDQAAVMKSPSSAKVPPATAKSNAGTTPAAVPVAQVKAPPKAEAPGAAQQAKAPAAAPREQKQAETPKTGDKKVAAAVAQAKPDKPATPVKEMSTSKAAAQQKDAAKSATQKKEKPVKEKAPSRVKAAAPAREPKTAAAAKGTGGETPAAGTWTVVVGSYLLEDAMAADMVRVRKAGFSAAVQSGPRKRTHMNRLLLSQHSSRDEAQAELNRLRKHTSDAFMLDQGGKFAVYAGSYLLDARAGSERERLAAAGFQLSPQKIDVAVPSKTLTAGSFSAKDAADAALAKLRAAGLKPSLVRQ